MDKLYVSEDGLVKLKEELAKCKARRIEVAAIIEHARGFALLGEHDRALEAGKAAIGLANNDEGRAEAHAALALADRTGNCARFLFIISFTASQAAAAPQDIRLGCGGPGGSWFQMVGRAARRVRSESCMISP